MNTTKTLDEYITALYQWLRQALGKAKEMAFQEARHHKRIYDKKAGAVELQPMDHVLVKMDTFWGQRRKLKNQWSNDLWKVVWRIVDIVPTYIVCSMKAGKTKVLHWARLLLWLADYTQDGLKVNVIRLEDDTLPSMMLEPSPAREEEGRTPFKFTYGLDVAKFGHSLDTPALMMDIEVQGMPMGTSQNETSLEMMDVDVQEDRVADDEQELGDIPHSPMTLAMMEF